MSRRKLRIGLGLLMIGASLPLQAQSQASFEQQTPVVGLEGTDWLRFDPAKRSPRFNTSESNTSGASSSIWSNRHRRRRGHRNRDYGTESYLLIKGGGLHLAGDNVSDGAYLGLELGGSVEDVVEMGFTLDYYHRSSNEMIVLQESEANDLPLRAIATLKQSSAHLLPLGLTMRIKIPIGDGKITPFISGTAAYEVLFLENNGTLDRNDPLQALLEDEETFTGFGWQLAVGAGVQLSPTFGLFGELGMHRSAPSQEIEFMDGTPAELKIDLDGSFLRAGLRIEI